MKMSPESFNLLSQLLHSYARLSPGAVAWYRRKLSPKEYRWRRFQTLDHWAYLSKRFYAEGLNDSHIDTALRRALKGEQS